MPSTKRPSDDHNSTPSASKLQRTDQNGDFSGNVKKKLSGSTRTGQACDRCKVRKIRCDARPGGCSPCLQNNTECRTTDRITGRATSRGHTENLENENHALRQYAAELQQQLKENGLEARPPPVVPQGYTPAGSSPSISSWPQAGQIPSWDIQSAMQQDNNMFTRGSLSQSAQSERRTSQGSLLPTFRSGCIGDNYLGVSSANDWLSPIKGTSLALFGMELDLAEFIPSEQDSASVAMSYQTFLSQAFNRSSQYAPVPPPFQYDEVYTYAEWYLRSINPFTPILHKPDFMTLLRKFAEDQHFQPSAAETVMVHMVLAIIKFQYSARNSDEQSRNASNVHYHYALSFFHDLMAGHTLQDVQALALICSHLRNFPRPGPAWMVTNMALGLAIELGLHRSVKAWQGSTSEKGAHEAEMRKRVFWSLMVYHVTLSGKLGRPMPLHLEDFDVEIPEPVFDNLPSESNMSKWRKCSFRAGIQGFKLLVVMMQVYSTIYSIRSNNRSYEATVKQLEREVQMFQTQLPPELAGGNQTHQEDRIFAFYIQSSVQECQLLLHHPALCRSTAPQVVANNTDLCLDASNKLLNYASQLSYLKSLDTTWHNATLYLAAVFTTLFVYTERKDQITSTDLNSLKEDMDRWLEVMGEVGNLLGSGTRLQTACRNIIDYYLGSISRHLAAKTASAAVASADISQSPAVPNAAQSSQHTQGYDSASNFNGPYGNAPNGVNGVDATSGAPPSYGMDSHSAVDQTQGSYPSGNTFAYPEPTTSTMPPYASANMPFDTTAYQEDVKPELTAQLAAHNASISAHGHPQHQQIPQQGQQAPGHFLAAFHSPPSANNGFQQQSQTPEMNSGAMAPGLPNSGPAAWRHFTDSMMNNMGPQEYLTSANALMALGAPKSGNVDLSAGSTMGSLSVNAVDMGQPWPLNTFNYNTGQPNGGQ